MIEHGRRVTRNLSSNHLTESDLLEELRLRGELTDISAIETAHIGRNGQISIIRREKKS